MSYLRFAFLPALCMFAAFAQAPSPKSPTNLPDVKAVKLEALTVAGRRGLDRGEIQRDWGVRDDDRRLSARAGF